MAQFVIGQRPYQVLQPSLRTLDNDLVVGFQVLFLYYVGESPILDGRETRLFRECHFYYHITNTQNSFSTSPSTPIAVTAAPAPAPWTISGRTGYRLVWNAMILSDPCNEVAKGWVTGYLWRVSVTMIGDERRKCALLQCSLDSF
jgi:hypothetical protein